MGGKTQQSPVAAAAATMLQSPLAMPLEHLVKAVIPANIRLYVSTMMGDRAPVTENDFTPRELDALKTAVRNDNEYKNTIRLEAAEAREALPLMSTPEKRAQTQTRLDRYNQILEEKPGIGYGDYPGNFYDGMNWWQALKSSYTDPGYVMATSLGLANREKDAQGNNIITDTYDFNSRPMLDAAAQNGQLVALLRDATNHPTMLLDYLGSLVAPQGAPNSRPVRIKMGMK